MVILVYLDGICFDIYQNYIRVVQLYRKMKYILKFIPEKMIPNYGEEVYQKISEITGLKFKSQIKDSGIIFEKIFEMHNLVTDSKNFLVTTDKENIIFNKREDFIQKFIMHLKESIHQLNNDYKSLLEQQNEAIVDDNLIFIENERIGYYGNKQLKLLNKMREFRDEIPDINIK